jgi:deazaflavin-dependent oxidoreductase (nitroreductase family)
VSELAGAIRAGGDHDRPPTKGQTDAIKSLRWTRHLCTHRSLVSALVARRAHLLRVGARSPLPRSHSCAIRSLAVATTQPERFNARVAHRLQRSLVNPLVRAAWRLGLGPPGDALLETTGRRTRRPRLTPICDGQDRDTFWVVTQRGRQADYVRNIEANPRVRVKVRRGLRTEWLAGTAHVVDGDDPRERQRIMARADFWRRICLQASGAMSTSPLTIRIDLDSR